MVGRIPQTENFGRQNQEKEQQRKETRDALRFDGSQFVRLYEKMQALIAEIGTTVTNIVNTITYTRTEIDTQVAGKADLAHTHTQDQVSGTWTKNVDNGTTGEVRTGDLYAAQAPGYNIGGTRLTAWLEVATGRLGYASSSRRYKTGIVDADIDPVKVLSITPKHFQYMAQLQERERRAALPSPYRDWNPDYQVTVESGFIAEDLADAGFGAPFTFTRDGVTEGVEYSMWPVAQQAALRWLADQNADLQRRIEALEGAS
jgi:hypothetical protein